MEKLSILNIERNQLEEIKILEQYVTPEISIINLKKNNIKNVCSLVSNSLTEIDLSFNKITNIVPFFKSSLPKLLIIKLNNNQIEGNLPKASFGSLKTLDISKNSLVNISEFSSKSNLPKMDNLKINNNKI